MRKIYKAAIRDLWFHKSRSFVIVLALVLVTAFPIAFLDLPYNLENIIVEEETEYGLAYLNVFYKDTIPANITNNIENIITDNSEFDKGQFIVESRMQFSSKMQAKGAGELPVDTWINVDVISIDKNNLARINQVVLEKGNYPDTTEEAVMLESQAIADGIVIGDKVIIYSFNGPYTVTISGFVKSIEYSSYQISQFGLLMLNPDGITQMLGIDGDMPITSTPIYFDKIDKDQLIILADKLEEELNKITEVALIWFVREASFREGLQDALKLTSEYMFAASIFIFLVAGVIIFVVMNRYVNEQKTTLGAIFSYGVKRRSIILSYVLKVAILSLFGIFFGLILAREMIKYLVNDMAEAWGLISTKHDFSVISISFTLVSSAVVTYTFTILAVANLLKMTPYEAMRGKTNELKNRGLIFMIGSVIPIKIVRNAVKNLTRNLTRSILTIIAFTLALSFAWSLAYTYVSIDYTVNNYYTNNVNFDMEINIGFQNAANTVLIDNITSTTGIDNVEPYVNQLVQLTDIPEKLTFLMGYYRNTSMFEIDNILSEGEWFDTNSSEIVLSRYVAGSFGFEIGDILRFNLLDTQFNMTVVGIANELISSSSIIVDIEYLNNYINPYPEGHPLRPTVFNNMLLVTIKDGYDINEIQDHLNKDFPEIIGAFTSDFYHQRFSSLANSQSAIILMMTTISLIVGAVSIFTTLLIAIVERERELALLQVFGYTRINLSIQILFEGIVVGLASVIPAFFLAKYITVNLWVAIVNKTLFELTPNFSQTVNEQMIFFVMISVVLAIIPSFRAATKRKIVEVLREE